MCRVKLLFLSVLVYPPVDTLQHIRLLQDRDLHRVEKALAVRLQLLHELDIDTAVQWLYVNHVPLAIHHIVHLAKVGIESLPFLLVVPQPVPLLGFADGLGEREGELEGLLEAVGEAREASEG